MTATALELMSAEYVVTADSWDVIPPELDADFKLGKMDRDWVWVAKRGAEVVGVLMASYCHGLAVIWRIAVTDNASHICIIRLLRTFLRDIHKRGCQGYLTLVNRENSVQSQLATVIEKAGGKVVDNFTLMAAPMPRENI